MGFRNFLIWVIKNMIMLLLITLIFSTAALDAPDLMKGLFKDIFQYASPEMQKEVVSKLTVSCSGLEEKDYDALQQQLANSPLPLDFKKISDLCKDYNGGKINDKQFFFNVVGSAIPDKFELPKANAFEKYNSIMDTLNRNKIIYFAVLAVLSILLYFLVIDIKLFITTLTGISFSMGILILLPYVAVILYDKLVGIDTTPLLASVLGGSFSFNAKSIISVVLLLILRTYTGFIIVLGILFLSIDIIGKFYTWKLKRQSKTSEQKPEKKSEKEELKKSKLTKERKIKPKNDDDESYKHRDRSTKEILDELEEMHKKKSKKD